MGYVAFLVALLVVTALGQESHGQSFDIDGKERNGLVVMGVLGGGTDVGNLMGHESGALIGNEGGSGLSLPLTGAGSYGLSSGSGTRGGFFESYGLEGHGLVWGKEGGGLTLGSEIGG